MAYKTMTDEEWLDDDKIVATALAEVAGKPFEEELGVIKWLVWEDARRVARGPFQAWATKNSAKLGEFYHQKGK